MCWLTPAVAVMLAVPTVGIARLWLVVVAMATAAVAWTYRRFLADYARSLTIPPGGSLEVTADHLIVRHAGVLASDIAIPWAVVRAVCIDDGTSAGAPADGPPRRFVLPGEDGGETVGTPVALFGPGRRRRRGGGVPLLAAAPVAPNALVLLEPPVEVPWRYPFVAGPFNPPWGAAWPARPLPAPAFTPGFFGLL